MQTATSQMPLDFNAPPYQLPPTPKNASGNIRDQTTRIATSIVASKIEVQKERRIETPEEKIDELARLLQIELKEKRVYNGLTKGFLNMVQRGQGEISGNTLLERIRTSTETFNFLKWGIQTATAKFLFEVFKCDPNMCGKSGWTLLMDTIDRTVKNSTDTLDIEILLDIAEIDINKVVGCSTALDIALTRNGCPESIIALLIKNGAKTCVELRKQAMRV